MPPSPSASPTSKKRSPTRRKARRRAVYQATIAENPWLPDPVKNGLTTKQVKFLLYEGREALFGGAAGGGKSVALLAAALQYVCQPGYSALIVRRTFKQLAKSDSILNKAKEWLLGRKDADGRKVRYRADEHMFTFPSGATLEFGHMDNEKAMFDYQGGSWTYVGADEATQFTEQMLAYPRTRQRRIAGSAVPVRWRGASNPGGIGHEFVKCRYIKGADGKPVSHPGRRFFPAVLADNPHIDREDYITQLRESGIDDTTLAQLLAGDWDAVPGGRFKAEWFKRYKFRSVPGQPPDGISTDGGSTWIPIRNCLRFATIDPAASEKTTADYTVASSWLLTPKRELCWLDMVRGQWEIPDIIPRVVKAAEKWKLAYVAIEAVAANQAVYQFARRARGCPPVERLVTRGLDKLVRATPAMVFARDGRLFLPHGAPWLHTAEGELVRFTGDEDQDAHDDIVDTLSYAVDIACRRDTGGGKPEVIGGSYPKGR